MSRADLARISGDGFGQVLFSHLACANKSEVVDEFRSTNRFLELLGGLVVVDCRGFAPHGDSS